MGSMNFLTFADNQKLNAFIQFTIYNLHWQFGDSEFFKFYNSCGNSYALEQQLILLIWSPYYFLLFYFFSFYLVGVFSPLFSRSLFYGGKYLSFTFFVLLSEKLYNTSPNCFPPKARELDVRKPAIYMSTCSIVKLRESNPKFVIFAIEKIYIYT